MPSPQKRIPAQAWTPDVIYWKPDQGRCRLAVVLAERRTTRTGERKTEPRVEETCPMRVSKNSSARSSLTTSIRCASLRNHPNFTNGAPSLRLAEFFAVIGLTRRSVSPWSRTDSQQPASPSELCLWVMDALSVAATKSLLYLRAVPVIPSVSWKLPNVSWKLPNCFLKCVRAGVIPVENDEVKWTRARCHVSWRTPASNQRLAWLDHMSSPPCWQYLTLRLVQQHHRHIPDLQNYARWK